MFIATPLIHLEMQLHLMQTPMENPYPQSSRGQVGNHRGHLSNFTKNKSKKRKMSFKVICGRKIKLYKKIGKVYLYKKRL